MFMYEVTKHKQTKEIIQVYIDNVFFSTYNLVLCFGHHDD